jgi:hypothetical protein
MAELSALLGRFPESKHVPGAVPIFSAPQSAALDSNAASSIDIQCACSVVMNKMRVRA